MKCATLKAENDGFRMKFTIRGLSCKLQLPWFTCAQLRAMGPPTHPQTCTVCKRVYTYVQFVKLRIVSKVCMLCIARKHRGFLGKESKTMAFLHLKKKLYTL